MRAMLAFMLLVSPSIVTPQVTPSSNLGCTVVADGGMACNGIGIPETELGKSQPKLFVTDFTVEPGGSIEGPDHSSDYLILGVNGGHLANDKAPFLHVSLEQDTVTLMPKGQPFRLRNKGPKNVEFRLVEIHRQK